ncbi:MAG TPA: hypothetical protein VMY41_13935 [Thermohalobaculum sp.]|nr:hypothetical protein [Thermohalobaculum sp.]
MSLIRPEAAATIRRWGEPAAAGGLVLLTGWRGITWVGQGGSLGWIVLAAAALALFWLRAAVLGALAVRPVTGAGLVVLREGEIGYMGPHGGGFLELDDLVRVDIYITAPGQDPVWRLIGRQGAALVIPATAEGAANLPEALTALPGFSDLAAVGVLQRERQGRHVIWERIGQRVDPPTNLYRLN